MLGSYAAPGERAVSLLLGWVGVLGDASCFVILGEAPTGCARTAVSEDERAGELLSRWEGLLL